MKRTNIKMAILIPSLAVLFVGIIGVITAVGILSSRSTSNLTKDILDARVNQYANEFHAFSQDVYGAVSTITPLISNFTNPDFLEKVPDPRSEVIGILQGALTSNDKIISMWSCWEPNAFDGKDADYANTPLHDASGRFIPYVYKDGSNIAIDAIVGYDDPVYGEFYFGPRNSGKPYATDPYIYNFNGKDVMIYTLAIPVFKDGRVVGVVGADINLDDVIKTMNNGHILDDGYLITLSPSGIIATHPNTDLLLDHYDTGWMRDYSTEIDSVAINGGEFSIRAFSDKMNTYIYYLASGVMLGDTGRYWVVCGIVPEKTVNAGSDALLFTIICIGIALILVVGITIFLIVRSRLKNLPILTASAEAIALGDIDVSIPDTGTLSTKNEISLLARAFSNMTKSIRLQSDILSRISKGDYSSSIHVRSDKDVINMAINDMLENTNNTLHQINTAAAQVSIGSRQIADGAQTLAQGATQQAAAVQELGASIGDVAAKTEQNAEMAKEAARLSDAIRKNAEKGSLQMDQMMQAVREINDASGQIEKVIKVIDDIAFQTNILALNAAVEAARAGQHGKGFAVVADEVRSLAAKSSEAAKDTGGLIENSIQKANIGFQIAGDTAASLADIVNSINRSVEIVSRIALLSNEQATAISMINTGVEQVTQVVQRNSATAQESAAASQEMSGQSNLLEQLVSRFELNDSYNLSHTSDSASSPLRFLHD